MFCKKCGAQNPEGVAFCTQCGAPMEHAAQQTSAQQQPAFQQQNQTQAVSQAQPASSVQATLAPAAGALQGFFKKDTQHANVKNYGALVGMAGGVLGVVASFVHLFFVVQEKSSSLSSLFGSSSGKTTSMAIDTVTPFFLSGQGQTDVTSRLSTYYSVVNGFWAFLAVLFFILCIASALYLFHKFQQPVSRVRKVSRIANAVLFGTFCLGFVLTLVFWVYSNNYLSATSYSALGITVTAGPAVLLYLFSTIALFVPLVWKLKSN